MKKLRRPSDEHDLFYKIFYGVASYIIKYKSNCRSKKLFAVVYQRGLFSVLGMFKSFILCKNNFSVSTTTVKPA